MQVNISIKHSRTVYSQFLLAAVCSATFPNPRTKSYFIRMYEHLNCPEVNGQIVMSHRAVQHGVRSSAVLAKPRLRGN